MRFPAFAAAFFLISSCLAGRAAQAFTLLGGAGLLGWNGGALTLHLTPDGCPIAADHLSSVISAAAKLWSSVPTSYLNITLGSPGTDTFASVNAHVAPGDPFVICDTNFSADENVDGNLVIALGGIYVIDPSTSRIAYGGIVLNAEAGKTANIQNFDDTSLSVIIAHEMGHMLGLGHSSDPRSIMSYDHHATELRLGQDDVDGITYLYPRDEGEGAKAFGCGTIAGIGESIGSGGSPGGPGGDVPMGPAAELALLVAACAAAVFAAKGPSKPRISI